MADTSVARKNEIAPKTLVEAFAEDIAVHGYKVSSFVVREDLEKQERTLSIIAHVSTGDATQEEMDLKSKRGRKSATAAEDGEAAS